MALLVRVNRNEQVERNKKRNEKINKKNYGVIFCFTSHTNCTGPKLKLKLNHSIFCKYFLINIEMSNLDYVQSGIFIRFEFYTII